MHDRNEPISISSLFTVVVYLNLLSSMQLYFFMHWLNKIGLWLHGSMVLTTWRSGSLCSFVVGCVDEVLQTGQLILIAIGRNKCIINIDRLFFCQILKLFKHFRLIGEKVHHFWTNLLDEVYTMGPCSILVHNEDHVWWLQIDAVIDDKGTVVLVLLNETSRWHTWQSWYIPLWGVSLVFLLLVLRFLVRSCICCIFICALLLLIAFFLALRWGGTIRVVVVCRLRLISIELRQSHAPLGHHDSDDGSLVGVFLNDSFCPICFSNDSSLNFNSSGWADKLDFGN